MHWEKRVCFRITVRRIVGVVVTASTVANLIIVGAVFGAESASAAPTMTLSPSLTAVSITSVSSTLSFTATAVEATSATAQTDTPGVTSTETSTPTSTPTHTPTDTPTPTSCAKRYDWPTYRIQRGNTLFWLASATGSTVQELMLANCLTGDLIQVGQLLYVPRLPMITVTPTLTLTPTSMTPGYACDRAQWLGDITIPSGTTVVTGAPFVKTWRLQNTGSCTWTRAYSIVHMDGESFHAPVSTLLPGNVAPGQSIDISLNMIAPSVPGSYGSSWMLRNASGALFGIGEQANLPWSFDIRVVAPTPTTGQTIVFQNPSVCLGSSNYTNLYLSFSVTLLNGQDVTSVTAISGQSVSVSLLDTGGGIYSGVAIGSGGYSPGMNVSYSFIAQDRSGQNIPSADYSQSLEACGPL